ncbi:MAG: hypothetical protein GXO63_00170 [Candidatus Micrarchaeota archaeon]|nr:hypothetical protein [Candidatus Micrarchaeota archaeon]
MKFNFIRLSYFGREKIETICIHMLGTVDAVFTTSISSMVYLLDTACSERLEDLCLIQKNQLGENLNTTSGKDYFEVRWLSLVRAPR